MQGEEKAWFHTEREKGRVQGAWGWRDLSDGDLAGLLFNRRKAQSFWA